MSQETKISNSLDEVKKMNIYEKLTLIQAKTVAKKDKENKSEHGANFSYRKLEGIIEALKPLLVEYRLNLRLSEKVLNFGEPSKYEIDKMSKTVDHVDRFYIQATATLINIDAPNEIIISEALSREALYKKGVQVEMLTGMATTYSRKKALEGLLLLANNDALDPDSIIDEQANFEEKKQLHDELYKSFEQEIQAANALDDKYQALLKRVRNSHLSKLQKSNLETMYTTKGQELNK
jgi:hypothetical protein